MITSLVYLVIALVVLCVVCALILYIIASAPWGDGQIKAMLRWAVIVIGCLIAILMLLNFMGVADVPSFRR